MSTSGRNGPGQVGFAPTSLAAEQQGGPNPDPAQDETPFCMDPWSSIEPLFDTPWSSRRLFPHCGMLFESDRRRNTYFRETSKTDAARHFCSRTLAAVNL